MWDLSACRSFVRHIDSITSDDEEEEEEEEE